ncbi:MAG: transglycosylase SLT domain-containing protein, partial [Rhodospirillaceae bacterium]|nr:transglycosylase SLT domain-containing protein [Rhodospirillaceae bacterium]
MRRRGKTSGGRAARLLRPREVILRQNGRLRYLVLTPRDQLRLAVGAIAVPLLLLGLAIGLAYARHAAAHRPIVVAAPQAPDPRYEALAGRVRAILEKRVAVSVQPGASDATFLTAALRALDAQRAASADRIETLQRQIRRLESARAGLERTGERIAADVERTRAALATAEAKRAAAANASLGIAERLREAQERLAAAESDRRTLERRRDILKAGLAATTEIAGHLAVVEQGYGARVDALARGLAASRHTTRRLVARLEELERKLAVAAGPRLVALARKRGVDLIDYLFPLFDLPDGDTPEPALVLAVMRQESGFSENAVSATGAAGLMQIMPDTAQQLADRLKLGYDDDKLLDPDFNIMLGQAYLDHLIRSYGGSYILALAAYNAGPSRVGEWIKRFGDPRVFVDDPLTWVDALPFRETRRYVNAVMCALQVYR